MSDSRDRDERVLERMRKLYRPEPMSPSEQVAFDAALRARLESPWSRARRLRVIAPAVAGLVAGIALWLVMTPPGTTPTPGFGAAHGTPSPTAEPLTPQAWDYAVLIPSELEGWSSDIEQMDELPEEYLALASALFGDR